MNLLELIINYTWEEINPVFIAKLIIDLVSLTILVRYIYLRHHHRTDLMLTFYSFNVIVFFISYLLNRVELSTGAAFGLFAIFHVEIQNRRDICKGYDIFVFVHSIGIGNGR